MIASELEALAQRLGQLVPGRGGWMFRNVTVEHTEDGTWWSVECVGPREIDGQMMRTVRSAHFVWHVSASLHGTLRARTPDALVEAATEWLTAVGHPPRGSK